MNDGDAVEHGAAQVTLHVPVNSLHSIAIQGDKPARISLTLKIRRVKP
jgi:hypothetical protein